jgi:hypothetical protein
MKWWLGGLVLVAALASAFNVVSLRLEHLMDPRWRARDIQLYIAQSVIGIATVVGLVLAFKRAAPKPFVFAAAALIVAAGFVPRAIFVCDGSQANSAQAVADRAYEAKLLADLEARKQDVEARIAARRPYTGEEAEEFIELVRHSNLTYMSLADHSAVAVALMQRALQGKVFDPNAPVKNRFKAGAPPLPLFVAFHRMIRQAPERPVEAREWKILLLMTGNGADLSLPVAEPVGSDLRKTATPVFDGLYLELK